MTPNEITIPRPHVPYGPEGMDVNRADAAYLYEAAHIIEWSKCMGSNLTTTVTKLLSDAADAIEGSAAAELAGALPAADNTDPMTALKPVITRAIHLAEEHNGKARDWHYFIDDAIAEAGDPR